MTLSNKCRTALQALAAALKKLYRLRHQMKVAVGKIISVEKGHLASLNGVRHIGIAMPAESKIVPPARFISNETAVPLPEAVSVSFPTVRVFVLPRARLLGPRAMPATGGRRLITEQTQGRKLTMLSSQDTLRPFAHLKASLHHAQEKHGSYFSINSPFAFNYYHWVTDCVPCLHTLEWLPLDAVLVVPQGMTSWQKRYLELLGAYERRVEEYEPDHWRLSKLFIQSWHRPDNHYLPPSPTALSWLRESLRGKIQDCPPGLPRRLFISRSDSKKARLENEMELSRLLERFGFQTIVLSGMSVDDQVKLFRNAQVVVGVHGAGMTNMLFADRPVLIEICPFRRFEPYFSSLVAVMDGEYFAYMADAVAPGGGSVLDLPKFEQAIAKVLEELEGRGRLTME